MDEALPQVWDYVLSQVDCNQLFLGKFIYVFTCILVFIVCSILLRYNQLANRRDKHELKLYVFLCRFLAAQ